MHTIFGPTIYTFIYYVRRFCHNCSTALVPYLAIPPICDRNIWIRISIHRRRVTFSLNSHTLILWFTFFHSTVCVTKRPFGRWVCCFAVIVEYINDTHLRVVTKEEKSFFSLSLSVFAPAKPSLAASYSGQMKLFYGNNIRWTDTWCELCVSATTEEILARNRRHTQRCTSLEWIDDKSRRRAIKRKRNILRSCLWCVAQLLPARLALLCRLIFFSLFSLRSEFFAPISLHFHLSL